MGKMIERAALAIMFVEDGPCDALYVARVVIEAMREPTEAMTFAPLDVNFSPSDAASAWKRMIDAALSTMDS